MTRTGPRYERNSHRSPATLRWTDGVSVLMRCLSTLYIYIYIHMCSGAALTGQRVQLLQALHALHNRRFHPRKRIHHLNLFEESREASGRSVLPLGIVGSLGALAAGLNKRKRDADASDEELDPRSD